MLHLSKTVCYLQFILIKGKQPAKQGHFCVKIHFTIIRVSHNKRKQISIVLTEGIHHLPGIDCGHIHFGVLHLFDRNTAQFPTGYHLVRAHGIGHLQDYLQRLVRLQVRY